jgi:hypothetical protein
VDARPVQRRCGRATAAETCSGTRPTKAVSAKVSNARPTNTYQARTKLDKPHPQLPGRHHDGGQRQADHGPVAPLDAVDQGGADALDGVTARLVEPLAGGGVRLRPRRRRAAARAPAWSAGRAPRDRRGGARGPCARRACGRPDAPRTRPPPPTSRGLAMASPSITTVVSAAITSGRSGWRRAATARALAAASRSTIASGASPSSCVSSTSGTSISKVRPRPASSSRRRGEADASTRAGTGSSDTRSVYPGAAAPATGRVDWARRGPRRGRRTGWSCPSSMATSGRRRTPRWRACTAACGSGSAAAARRRTWCASWGGCWPPASSVTCAACRPPAGPRRWRGRSGCP